MSHIEQRLDAIMESERQKLYKLIKNSVMNGCSLSEDEVEVIMPFTTWATGVFSPEPAPIRDIFPVRELGPDEDPEGIPLDGSPVKIMDPV